MFLYEYFWALPIILHILCVCELAVLGFLSSEVIRIYNHSDTYNHAMKCTDKRTVAWPIV